MMLDLILPWIVPGIGGALVGLIPSAIRFIQRRKLNQNVNKILGLLEDQRQETGSEEQGEETGDASIQFLTTIIKILWGGLSPERRKSFLDWTRDMRNETLHRRPLDKSSRETLSNFEELYNLLNKDAQE